MGRYTYLGPADNFILDDKLYHPGEAISMPEDQKINHELNGHRFAESNEAEIAVAIASTPAPRAETLPRGDRGEVIDVARPRGAPPVGPLPAPAVPESK
jgi:hypothetical protein